MAKVSLNKVFIYLTEKCNLDCDYCFFKDKTARRTLPEDALEMFLDWISKAFPSGPAFIEFSGGEPLLEWERLKTDLQKARLKFPASQIGIQTNGLLLDDSKQAFFKKLGIQIEVGLDGALPTTRAHRRGISAAVFRRLLENIKNSLKKGLDVSCTQTVSPDEVRHLKKNTAFLKNAGLKNIDVTPAALTPWTPARIRSFKKEYQDLLSGPRDGRRFFLDDDVTFLDQQSLDLCLCPPGHVLCGDVFLCLTEQEKKRKAVLILANGKKRFQKRQLQSFLRSLQKASARQNTRTYKDYVLNCFQILGEWFPDRRTGCRAMIELLSFQKRVHQHRVLEDKRHVRTH